MILQGVANVFLVLFAFDGVLSLADATLQWAGGSSLVMVPRNALALLVFLLAQGVGLALVVSPRLPLAVFLPCVVTTLWLGLGGLPLPLMIDSTPVLHMVAAGLQVLAALGAFALLWWKNSGASVFLQQVSMGASGFSARRALVFVLASLLLGPPVAVVYAGMAVAKEVDTRTRGFVSFDGRGIKLAERHYAKEEKEVWLVGMMHIGDEEAYSRLFESFALRSTIVLEEGVSDEDRLLSVGPTYVHLAASLGLTQQQGVESYFGPEPSAGSDTAWRPDIRNADMDMRDFSPQTIAFLERLAVLLRAEELLPALRDWLQYPVTKAELAQLEKDLIGRRNRFLLGEISSALEAYQRVVVPWGGLHLPEVEQELISRGFELEHASEHRIAAWGTMLAGIVTR